MRPDLWVALIAKQGGELYPCMCVLGGGQVTEGSDTPLTVAVQRDRLKMASPEAGSQKGDLGSFM